MLGETATAVSLSATPPLPEGEADGAQGAAAELTAPMKKWGVALDGGFQILPDLLLRCQRELDLTTNDVVVLLNLTMAWWERDRLPFPRTATIARRMDTSERTVQRSIDRLRKLRLLYKTTRRDAAGETRPAFDLSPLAAKLQEIAQTDPLSERRRALRAGEAGAQTQPPAQAQ